MARVVSNAPSIFPLGNTTVTWTVTDGSGNIASATQTVTVTDNQAPVITFSCSDANTLTYNPGDCGAIFNYTVSTSDNCSGTISLTRTLGLASGSSFPLGITTVTYTAVDANGNTSSKSFTVTVNPLIITPVITINPSAVQFSDSITFAATLAGGAPGTCNTSAGAAQTVSFYIGGYLMGTVPLTVSGSDLVGTLTTVLLENTPPADFTGGPLSPGTKNVTASFNSLNSNFTVLAGNSPQLSIQQEDARVTYTGVLFASTGNINSSTAIVTLSATIQDISAISNSGDGAPGDIRYAKVQFVNKNNNSTIGPVLSVVLVNVNDRKTGTVTYDWTTPAFTGDGTEFQIGIRVLNYYSRYSSDEDVVVQVSKPASDFVSGGGFLLLSNSAGEMAGTSGTKNNFGFNIKYNKSNRNLQGSINCIFRRVDAGGVVRVYQVKGNQMSSLRVNSSTKEFTFSGKANVQDITNPLAPISLFGNATFQMKGVDNGEPGSTDKISFTVYKNNGLWYCSNWSGSAPVDQLLSGGNLKAAATQNISSRMIENEEVSRGVVTLSQNYPNPAKYSTSFIIESKEDKLLTVHLFDALGKLVQSLPEELYSRDTPFEITMNLSGLSNGMYYIVVTGDGVNVSRKMWIMD